MLTVVAATLATPTLSPAQVALDALPPHEIVTSVRSAGLEPVSRPAFRGTTYVLQAVDESDQLVRVIVDARSGRVLSVRSLIAVGTRAYEPLPPISLRRPFGPRVVYGGRYPDDEFAPVPMVAAPRPPAAVRMAPPGARSAALKPAQPPLPRPKPQSGLAAKTAPAAEPAAAPAKTSELATGSVTPKPSMPPPVKPAGPEFPPMQTLE